MKRIRNIRTKQIYNKAINTNKQKNNNTVKFIVLISIILIIGIIWVFKNSENNVDNEIQTGNPDFALNAKTLDLNKLKSYNMPMMIDFGSKNCQPCREMEVILKQTNKDFQNKAIIKYVDVGVDQRLANGFPLEVIPTQFFYDKNGNPYLPSNPKRFNMIVHINEKTNEHEFTYHKGILTVEQIVAIFKDMGVE
jgi:thioredoxin 1